jgi:hypothetical protein
MIELTFTPVGFRRQATPTGREKGQGKQTGRGQRERKELVDTLVWGCYLCSYKE